MFRYFSVTDEYVVAGRSVCIHELASAENLFHTARHQRNYNQPVSLQLSLGGSWRELDVNASSAQLSSQDVAVGALCSVQQTLTG